MSKQRQELNIPEDKIEEHRDKCFRCNEFKSCNGHAEFCNDCLIADERYYFASCYLQLIYF